MKNINKLSISLFALVLLAPSFIFGATLKADEEISIKKGENIVDNLYLAGGSVTVNSLISGDLFTAGGQVIISEDVTDDMAILGGTVTILGDAGGDIRVAGGNIIIAGNVAGDLIVTGGTVTVASGVVIGKDLVMAGGQISFDGEVLGDAQIAGGVATINGHIKGNLKAVIAEKLTLGAGSTVDGNIEYSAKKAEMLDVQDGAVITGEISYEKRDATETEKDLKGLKYFILATLGLFLLLKLATLIIIGFILAWLFKDFSNSLVRKAIQKPMQMLGKGFVAIVVIPAAAILLLITLFGIPLGIIAILVYSILLTLAGLYSGIVFGVWVNNLISKRDKIAITWKNILGGIFLLALLGFIPFIGWIIALIVFLITLGSLADTLHKKVWKER